MLSINNRPFSINSFEVKNYKWEDFPKSENDGLRKNPYFQNSVLVRMPVEHEDGKVYNVQLTITDFETRKVPDWLKSSLLEFSQRQPDSFTLKRNIESFGIKNEYQPCKTGCGSNNYLLFPIEEVKQEKKVEEKKTKSKKSSKND